MYLQWCTGWCTQRPNLHPSPPPPQIRGQTRALFCGRSEETDQQPLALCQTLAPPFVLATVWYRQGKRKQHLDQLLWPQLRSWPGAGWALPKAWTRLQQPVITGGHLVKLFRERVYSEVDDETRWSRVPLKILGKRGRLHKDSRRCFQWKRCWTFMVSGLLEHRGWC